MAIALNNLFIIIIEKCNIQQTEKWDGYLSSKRFISWILALHTNNSSHWSWGKKYNKFSETKKSCYDEMASKIWKTCAFLISHPLRLIYNHSPCTGIFPDHLKIAAVKPLYKKGDKTSMTNYRRVSQLTVFSKVFKKAMPHR